MKNIATKAASAITSAEAASADITVVVPRILPPEAQPTALRIDEIYDNTAGLVIYDDDEEHAWSESLKVLKGSADTLTKMRMERTRVLDQSKQLWMMLFRNPLTHAEIAERRIKDAIIERHRRIERENQQRAAAAQQKQREQAEADARMKAAKLEAAGKPVEAQRVIEQAKTAELPPAIADAKPEAQAEGIAIKRPMKFELIEGQEDLVPREFCSPDEKKIRAFVIAYGEKAVIPGVRIWRDMDISARKTSAE